MRANARYEMGEDATPIIMDQSIGLLVLCLVFASRRLTGTKGVKGCPACSPDSCSAAPWGLSDFAQG